MYRIITILPNTLTFFFRREHTLDLRAQRRIQRRVPSLDTAQIPVLRHLLPHASHPPTVLIRQSPPRPSVLLVKKKPRIPPRRVRHRRSPYPVQLPLSHPEATAHYLVHYRRNPVHLIYDFHPAKIHTLSQPTKQNKNFLFPLSEQGSLNRC